jgi:succinate dehydrogenase / fumarate reductase flavoprotein subunit
VERIAELRKRIDTVAAPPGRRYNPGWHLCLDLRNMLMVGECVARAALERQESRGGHTRDDFPAMSAEWRQVNLVCTANDADEVTVVHQPLPEMPRRLQELFERSELAKYLTDAELAAFDQETSTPDVADAGTKPAAGAKDRAEPGTADAGAAGTDDTDSEGGEK